MRGRSRPKDGVLSHACDPRIHRKMNQFKIDGLPGQARNDESCFHQR
jgi:hypothetical protein